MEPLMLLILLMVGLATGVISGLFGVGGGFILVPLLTLIGIPIQHAIGLSQVYILIVALVGVYQHFRQRTVDVVLAACLAAGSVITAQIGALLVTSLSAAFLKLCFGILTMSVSILYLVHSHPTETTKVENELPSPENKLARNRETSGSSFLPHSSSFMLLRRKIIRGEEYIYRLNWPLAFVIGSGVGFVSGMFGVGGGFLMMPLMVSVLGIPLKIAIGTSLLSVIAPSASGSLSLWFNNHLDLEQLPPLVIGGLIGVSLGSLLVTRLSDSILKRAFTGLLLLVSAYMFGLGLGLF